MTAKEMKIKTFSLIEEYFPALTGLAEDEDVLYKINGVINSIQMDLMPLRKLNAVKEIEIEDGDSNIVNLKTAITDLYQIKSIKFDDVIEYEMPDEITLVLPEGFIGTFKVYYYKLPSLMTLTFESPASSAAYDSTYTFELDQVLLEIMPYGIAADLLKMDMISSYGKYFQEEYMMRKNQVDSRMSSGQIIFEGGLNV